MPAEELFRLKARRYKLFIDILGSQKEITICVSLLDRHKLALNVQSLFMKEIILNEINRIVGFHEVMYK